MLEGEWLLTPIGEDGCRVELTMKFAFKNPLTAVLFEQKFAETMASLIDAFVSRARTVPAEDALARSDAWWPMRLVNGSTCGPWMLPAEATIADAIDAARRAARHMTRRESRIAAPICEHDALGHRAGWHIR